MEAMQKENSNHTKLTGIHILVACLFGIFIAWIALAANMDSIDLSYETGHQRMTQQTLGYMQHWVASYEEQQVNATHTRALVPTDNIETYFFDGSKIEKDGWGRPFLYTKSGSHYRVTSYGRDGKPGGVGWDADLTSDNPKPKAAALTVLRVAFNPGAREGAVTALIAGVMAGVLCFLMLRKNELTLPNRAFHWVRLVAVATAAAVVAIVITSFHIPHGH
jgi:hypothetical protein